MFLKTQHHLNTSFVCDNGTYTEQKDNYDKAKDNSKHTLDLSETFKATEDYYDPHLHREVAHPTTNLETLLHLLKGSLGTGILAMPNAFSNSGYVLGSIGTLFIGFICTYSLNILIKSEYELCKRKKIPSLTYPGIAEAAFGEGPKLAKKFAPYSGHVVNIFLLIYQFGACCVYIVFVAINIQAVANQYVGEIAVQWYMLMFLIPLIFLNWIRKLKRLAPLSTIANVITMGSFAIILYYLIRTGLTLKNRETFSAMNNLPLFFGMVLFALEAVGMVIPLENEMQTPKAYVGICGVLNKGMTIIVLLYGTMGLLGYLTYGSATEATITLNLPKDEILAQLVKGSLALAIFLSYAIQYYVGIDIIWNQYLGPKLENHPRVRIFEYSVRTIIVLMTSVLAAAVPALDLFISLFGAFCLSAIGIAIPAAIETCTFWYYSHGWDFYLMTIKNFALILFGCCGFVAGTYSSIRDIIHKFP